MGSTVLFSLQTNNLEASKQVFRCLLNYRLVFSEITKYRWFRALRVFLRCLFWLT